MKGWRGKSVIRFMVCDLHGLVVGRERDNNKGGNGKCT